MKDIILYHGSRGGLQVVMANRKRSEEFSSLALAKRYQREGLYLNEIIEKEKSQETGEQE